MQWVTLLFHGSTSRSWAQVTACPEFSQCPCGFPSGFWSWWKAQMYLQKWNKIKTAMENNMMRSYMFKTVLAYTLNTFVAQQKLLHGQDVVWRCAGNTCIKKFTEQTLNKKPKCCTNGMLLGYNIWYTSLWIHFSNEGLNQLGTGTMCILADLYLQKYGKFYHLGYIWGSGVFS